MRFDSNIWMIIGFQLIGLDRTEIAFTLKNHYAQESKIKGINIARRKTSELILSIICSKTKSSQARLIAERIPKDPLDFGYFIHVMAAKATTWHPAVPIRPADNLVSSEMIRFKRFVPSYERESRPDMAKIISHDYARIWQRDRKDWEKLCLRTTTKRRSSILLRKVVNANLRKKQECPEKYRSKAEFRYNRNPQAARPRVQNRDKKIKDGV